MHLRYPQAPPMKYGRIMIEKTQSSGYKMSFFQQHNFKQTDF